MRKIPKKSQLKRPEHITIKFDPLIMRNSIVMPKIKYEVTAEVDTETKFTGKITPMPTVLIYFLTHMELSIISLILEETYENGGCDLSVIDIALRLAVTTPTISAALYKLRKNDLLLEERNMNVKGLGRRRLLNFEAIQHLNDLVEGEDPGIYARIRKATRRSSILRLTKEDIRCAYNNKILPPDHDPEEEEEYD